MIYRTRTVLLAAVIVLLLSGAGYWGVHEYRKRELHHGVVSLVTETSQRLRTALSTDLTAGDVYPLELAGRLDEQARDIDERLELLRRRGTRPNRALFDAAELYVITARELLRRKAASHRHGLELSSSRQALQDLMRDASHRSTTWIAQAMRAKEQFEVDSFNYRLAVDAIGSLLESFPDTRAQLRPHLDATLLLDESLCATARQQAREEAKRVKSEVEQVRQFAALR